MTGETIAQPKFVLCIRNDGCDDLEPRKVYQVLEDPSAREEEIAKCFSAIELPKAAVKALAVPA